MLCSFADLVATSPHAFCRPQLRLDGPLVVKSGRHPVISTLPLQQMASSFVANDLFLSPLENLHIITGPNGSGKVITPCILPLASYPLHHTPCILPLASYSLHHTPCNSSPPRLSQCSFTHLLTLSLVHYYLTLYRRCTSSRQR